MDTESKTAKKLFSLATLFRSIDRKLKQTGSSGVETTTKTKQAKTVQNVRGGCWILTFGIKSDYN